MTQYTAYRGQHCDSPNLTNRMAGLCFSTLEVATDYATRPNIPGETVVDPKVFTAVFDIDAPFINQPKDCYLDLEDLLKLLPGITQADIPVPLSDQCDYPTYQVWQLLDHPDVIGMLKSRGFDGAIYGGSGCGGGEPEYRIFDRSQITVLRTQRL